jgi:phytoene synthase
MPRSSPEAHDFTACRALMRGGSRSFFAASLLLPARVMRPATALYAFCRLADDAIDEGACTAAALAELRERLSLAYAGAPLPFAADRAFAHAVARFEIPRALPLALLEGFEWDSQGRRYEDFESLQTYAARVAGTVGAMMAVLMGVRSEAALARATDLGIAMQLTNIARDVGEDARMGRIYLPLAWLRAEGVDPDSWLADPRFSPAIGRVVRRLVEAADALYARAEAGVAQLPASCRPGIRAAGLIYAAIGREAARAGYDTVSRRARVSGSQKMLFLARSLTAVLPQRSRACGPALVAAHYLVEAARRAPAPARLAWHRAAGVAFDARVTWVFDLFERLADQELETL